VSTIYRDCTTGASLAIPLASAPIVGARTYPAGHTCRSGKWGGRDSNPRPRDYESMTAQQALRTASRDLLSPAARSHGY